MKKKPPLVLKIFIGIASIVHVASLIVLAISLFKFVFNNTDEKFLSLVVMHTLLKINYSIIGLFIFYKVYHGIKFYRNVLFVLFIVGLFGFAGEGFINAIYFLVMFFFYLYAILNDKSERYFNRNEKS